jgi:hypothetical protein
MTARKGTILALGGVAACLLVLLFLVRVWPFVALSLWQKGLQTKFHCWVKVVDQNDRGVKAYQCRVIEEYASLWPHSSGRDVVRVFKTGDDGIFEYESKGATGRVFFGYDCPAQWTLNPRHLMQTHYLAVSSLEYQRAMKEEAISYMGSQNNPYVIHVFSIGPPRKLLYWKARVNLEEKTNYACIELLSGRVWESKTPEGDVAMADIPVDYSLYPHLNDPYNAPNYRERQGDQKRFAEDRMKSVLFKAGKGCDLLPVVDDWGLGPPENGYKKELYRPRDWEALSKVYRSEILLYYRLQPKEGGREYYGRLTLGLSPRVDGALIESYTNLQGERNLFYTGYTDLMDQKILDFVSPPVH